MTVAVAAVQRKRHAESRDGRLVIAGFVAGKSVRGAAIWGAVFGLWVMATIRAFVTGYPTINSRLQVAGSLGAFSMFLGNPQHLETVAGFTTWRVLVVMVTIGAIWGLLTSTSLLRGEEDAGRWELLVAGPTTRRRATAMALLGLGGALAAMFLVTALATLAAGHLPGAHFAPSGSLLFAMATVSGAAIFLSVGALLSQLSATRGRAVTIGAVLLGLSYVVRMIADSNRSLGWARWLSPIGWLEELHPLQNVQLPALLPVVVLVLTCSGLAVALAGRRDLNASILREREGNIQLSRWLVGPVSLALRVSGPTAFAWLAGTAGMAAVYGSLTRSATTLLSSSSLYATTLGRLGVHKMSEGYLGVVFLMVAVLISLIAAGQVGAIRDEEASGRLDNLVVRPVPRLSWLLGRVGISLALVLLCGLAAGTFAWWGAASQHTGVALPKLLEAGLNATVPGVFVLGAGVLVLGLRPHLTATAAYGIVAWSFLIDLLGALIKDSDWLRNSSLFSHIELAPAANPNWGTAAVIVLIGVGATVLGSIAFQMRDLEYT
jgi:ABC-2 type transport system permease protein